MRKPRAAYPFLFLPLFFDRTLVVCINSNSHWRYIRMPIEKGCMRQLTLGRLCFTFRQRIPEIDDNGTTYVEM